MKPCNFAGRKALRVARAAAREGAQLELWRLRDYSDACWRLGRAKRARLLGVALRAFGHAAEV